MNQDLHIVRENILGKNPEAHDLVLFIFEKTPALTQNLLNLVFHNIPMKPVT